MSKPTGTLRLKARFDNQAEMLIPNQFVNVRLRVQTLKDAILMPSAALQFGARGTFAYVVGDDNKVQLRTLEVGPSNGETTVVTGGLAAGERIVMEGTDRLRDGSEVDGDAAFLAASVVGRFEGTIEKIVALAVLMPIVAGMGGNAGTQVLALMVRGLALGQVGPSNAKVLLWKELRVALLNGAMLGSVVALVALAWFRSWGLSLVIGTALTITFCAAALAGVLVPLGLKRAGYDPALAGGVILTTVTDVIGFLSFLGLATLVLIR